MVTDPITRKHSVISSKATEYLGLALVKPNLTIDETNSARRVARDAVLKKAIKDTLESLAHTPRFFD